VVLDRKAQEKQRKAASKGKVIGPPKLQMLQVGNRIEQRRE